MLNLHALPHAPQRLRVDYPIALADVPVCFTDCETTGLHAGRRVWEAAFVRREPDGTMFALELMVSDVDLSQADEEGLRIGRFDQRHPLRGGDPGGIAVVPESEVAQCIAEFVRGAHIAGAVPNFDVWSYQEMLDRHRAGLDASEDPAQADLLRQLQWEGHYHLIDVETLVAGRLALPPPYSSDGLTAQVGVNPVGEDRRHTAMGDTLWGMRLYDAALTGVGDFPVEVPITADRLAELRSAERPGLLAEPGTCCRDTGGVLDSGIIVTGEGACSDAGAGERETIVVQNGAGETFVHDVRAVADDGGGSQVTDSVTTSSADVGCGSVD